MPMKCGIGKYSVALGLVSVIAVGPALAQESGLVIGGGAPVYDAGATATTSFATSDFTPAASATGGLISDTSGFPASAVTIAFDEFAVPGDTVVTDQYDTLGVTFSVVGVVGSVQSPQACIFPGLNTPGCLSNFTADFTSISCPGPRSIFFDHPVAMAGFNIVTNGNDSTRLTAYLGDLEVDSQVVDTNLTQAFFVGFVNSGGFDELELEIIPDSEGDATFRCMLLDNLTFASVLPVDIDIKPGSFPNTIHLGSRAATPVAILGSDTLDVTDIDASTLSIASAGVKTVGKKNRSKCRVKDVSGDFSVDELGMPDGFDDLVCYFVTIELVPEVGDTTLTLSGNLLPEAGGLPIEGIDSVIIVP